MVHSLCFVLAGGAVGTGSFSNCLGNLVTYSTGLHDHSCPLRFRPDPPLSAGTPARLEETSAGGILTENPFDDLGLDHAGQLLIEAAVKIGQLPIIESHQVEDGCMQIAKMVPIDNRLMP